MNGYFLLLLLLFVYLFRPHFEIFTEINSLKDINDINKELIGRCLTL